MFAKLKQVLGAQDLDRVIASDLENMLDMASRLLRRAGEVFAGGSMSDEERETFYASDRRINAMEQKIRRQVVSRVTLSTPVHRTRLLAFVGLVKDVERLGDYAKNLLEAAALLPSPRGSGAVPAELADIRKAVEEILGETQRVLHASDEQRAWVLLDRGHRVSKQCDGLIARLAGSTEPAAVAVPAAIATRYYKRIDKHLMNLLSSVVMPLDKVGYYDSDER